MSSPRGTLFISQVTNIAPTATEDSLGEFFGTAGDITSIELKPGDGTKYATVVFAEKEAVNAAVMLNGCLVLNYALSITALPHVPGSAEQPAGAAQEPSPTGTGNPGDVTAPAAELSPFENQIAGFFGKTIVAGKKAVEAVKEFDREKGITAGAKAKISARTRCRLNTSG